MATGAALYDDIAPEDRAFTRPYLLALNVALVAHDGRYWADASWAKDLLRHLEYIERLTLLCPIERCVPDEGWEALPTNRLRIVGYDAPRSGRQFLSRLPRLCGRLWREVGAADIVHSGIAGWPIPLGWLTTPMARLRGKKIVLIVESAFWRAPSGARRGLAQRLKAACGKRPHGPACARRTMPRSPNPHTKNRCRRPAPVAVS